MQNFSLYETVLKIAKDMGHELRSLGETDLADGEASAGSTAFLTRLGGMRSWCRAVECKVIEDDLRDARVFAGFQRMSRVRGVLRRYQKICEQVGEVWVFAQEDWRPTLPHARLVAIDDVELCREWFLLIESRRQLALLSGREIDGSDRNRVRADRRFEAVSTFHPELVLAAREAIEDWIASFL